MCEATTGKYIQPEKTDKEKYTILVVVQEQHRQAIKRELVNCADCKHERPLYKLYRCFFCGRYYCPACALYHFT